MAKDVRIEQKFNAPPERIRSALTDPSFLTRRAQESGGSNVEVSVQTDADGHTATVVRRLLPAQVPSFARALVSDTISLVEEQSWGPITEDACTGTFVATFSAPMSGSGDMTLEPDGTGGTRMTSRISLKANVPLVGGKLEALVAEQTVNYLNFTEQLVREWLAQNP
jgi:uncharacterized protein YndB with AHSA1/START domain